MRLYHDPDSQHRSDFSLFILACGLALGPTVVLGFARFAYGLLLPSMQHDLHWTYTQAGTVNTANAIGYLAGSIVAAPLVSRLGAHRTFLSGIIVTILALVLSAAVTTSIELMALRAVAGIAAALTFIAGAGLVAHLARSGQAALALALFNAGGGGFGIALSGSVLPVVLAHGGDSAWRTGWLALGILATMALGVAAIATRRATVTVIFGSATGYSWNGLSHLWPTFVCYGLFGTGYIIYMTFIITFLHTAHLSPAGISLFWIVLGSAAIAGSFIWIPVLNLFRSGLGPAAALCTVCVGVGLPLLSTSLAATLASAILFGGSFLAVVTGVTTLARRMLPASMWTSTIGLLTVVFAVGQCIGPVVAGALADSAGGVRAGLELSLGLLFVGMVISVLQRAG